MCNKEHGGTLGTKTHDGIVKERLADVSINGREWVIETNNIGVVIERTGNVDTLLLTTTEVDTLLADLGQITSGQDGKIGLKLRDADGFPVALLVHG